MTLPGLFARKALASMPFVLQLLCCLRQIHGHLRVKPAGLAFLGGQLLAVRGHLKLTLYGHQELTHPRGGAAFVATRN